VERPAERDPATHAIIKGERLPLGYRVDFICFDSVLVEVKALAAIGSIEQYRRVVCGLRK
jgi:hypothetical protein